MRALVFGVAIVGAMISGFVFADAFGPVGNAMKQLSGDLMCLQGQLPTFICGQGDHLAAFEQTVKTSRGILLQVLATNDTSAQEINLLFDRLDASVAKLRQARESGDVNAQAEAFSEISEVRKEGHLRFKMPH